MHVLCLYLITRIKNPVEVSIIHYENMTLKMTLKTTTTTTTATTTNSSSNNNRVTLEIERTKDMNNADHFQWDYKGH